VFCPNSLKREAKTSRKTFTKGKGKDSITREKMEGGDPKQPDECNLSSGEINTTRGGKKSGVQILGRRKGGNSNSKFSR